MPKRSSVTIAHEYLNLAQAAELLGFHPTHMVRLARSGGGPPRSKIGRAVRYRRVDLIKWMDSRREIQPAA